MGDVQARRTVVLAACGCARLALTIYEARQPDDDRPRRAIEVAEAWACGGSGVSLDDVRAADAAAFAAQRAEKEKTLAQCADIVRKHYPTAPKLGRKK